MRSNALMATPACTATAARSATAGRESLAEHLFSAAPLAQRVRWPGSDAPLSRCREIA
jgi:hypothetical protein